MTVLSSRAGITSLPTHQQMLDAARPSINLVKWITSMVQFPDDSPQTVRAAAQTIEGALECLLLPDYAVLPVIGAVGTLNYDVAVKPIAGAKFVAFQAQFRIQP